MKTLDISQFTAKDPLGQFKVWYDEAKAKESDQFDPSSMTIATASKDGAPSCRMMQLKGFDDMGFKFYGNYGSRWSKELEANPRASLQFYWEPFKRMVRIEGRVEKLSDKESDEYFHSRSKASQIGSLVSHQTKPIAGRKTLDEEFKKMEEKYKSEEVPRPAEWGGFRVLPESLEFWQRQDNRLHDRLLYRKPAKGETPDNKVTLPGTEGWLVERLSP